MKKDKISIALTKSLIKQINDECKKTGLSRSSFIELIIRQHYQNNFREAENKKIIQPQKIALT
jgi:metal-responsive CopG/Arc/MetJ family transcriptional regulator